MTAVKHQHDAEMELEEGIAAASPETRARHQHVTPLPMSQILPMTFVLVNESLCGTMLLPFVGLLVSHLENIPPEKAGYVSGILIGVFMLGQMVSSRLWGRISDKYGRRFPIISGLFTSGLMMLGFGLSTSVWLCAVFRFFHGLFNGNVLVAKTMMADITDKSNQAKGFAFVSLCYGFGVLCGPTLGGLLYDPANSSALRWAHISEESIFSRRPAFLPSLVIFIYTNIGMVVCTFFVMESNPHAKQLPKMLRLLYPCFWRDAKMFVHPSTITQERTDRAVVASDGSDAAHDAHTSSNENSIDGMSISICTTEGLGANVSMTHAGDALFIASPVHQEDRRVDDIAAAETLTMATVHTAEVMPRYGQSTLSRLLRDGSPTTNKRSMSNGSSHVDASIAPTVHPPSLTSPSARERFEKDDHGSERSTTNAAGGTGGEKTSAEECLIVAHPHNEQAKGETTVLRHFGYKQACQTPVVRTMLIYYMLLSGADMLVREIIPLWAIAPVSVGGLDFGADKVGYVILTNGIPCVASNLLFHRACRLYDNKLSMYRVSLAWCGISICILPFVSYLKRGSLVFIAVVIITGIRQFFASWAYGLVTMLTATAAPSGHIGSVMGINQSSGALTRTIVPFFATPLFAWSITSHHSFPFDHSFVFLISGATFMISYVYSVWLRTNADAKLEMNEESPEWMAKVKRVALGCYAKVCGTSCSGAETRLSQ